MKRWMLGVMAILALVTVQHEGVVAGSKWKPWKHTATCAMPACSTPSCFAPSCFGPGCFGPMCSAPVCSGPGCFAPGCSAPGCFGPNCGGCSQPVGFAPGCFAPGCGGPMGPGCGAPWLGQPVLAPNYAGYEVIPTGPMVGGVSLTPAYYAPLAPQTFTVPAIPIAEDIAW